MRRSTSTRHSGSTPTLRIKDEAHTTAYFPDDLNLVPGRIARHAAVRPRRDISELPSDRAERCLERELASQRRQRPDATPSAASWATTSRLRSAPAPTTAPPVAEALPTVGVTGDLVGLSRRSGRPADSRVLPAALASPSARG